MSWCFDNVGESTCTHMHARSHPMQHMLPIARNLLACAELQHAHPDLQRHLASLARTLLERLAPYILPTRTWTIPHPSVAGLVKDLRVCVQE